MEMLPLPDLPPSKLCRSCQRVLPLEEFHRNRSRRDGRQYRCRECNIEANKRWYREHPEARANRMDEYARRRRRRLQQLLLEYLRSHRCVDCGEEDPVVLEFDHLRDKIDNVTRMVVRRLAWSAVLDEIAKCEVVCANCHRRRTAQRSQSYRYRGGLSST